MHTMKVTRKIQEKNTDWRKKNHWKLVTNGREVRDRRIVKRIRESRGVWNGTENRVERVGTLRFKSTLVTRSPGELDIISGQRDLEDLGDTKNRRMIMRRTGKY